MQHEPLSSGAHGSRGVDETIPSRRRSVWSALTWVAFLLGGVGLGVLFGWWAFAPPAIESVEQAPASVTVEIIEVGLTVPLPVTAAWDTTPLGVNGAEGTLTSLNVSTGDLVNAGDVLYTVDLRPVTFANGNVPFFRDLSQDMTGEDVREVSKDDAKSEASQNQNALSRFIKMIADIFVPMLPALVAGGLMMSLNNVMTAQGLFGPRDDVPLASPLRGIVVALENTPDAGFASGAVGAGAAIYPTENLVRSPGSGKVVMTFPTGHAVGLRLDSGLEVLIHIGIDTVQMNGTGFEVHVRKGDSVDLGTPLVSFNRDAIEAAGYSPITPVLVTNHRRFSSVDLVAGGPIDFGDELLVVEPKEPAAD